MIFDSQHRADRIHAALTLLELIIVIAVVGLLVAIILPAVQYAREAARRAQCQANLRQLGIALHSYGTSYGTYPCILPQGFSWVSVHARLLPFLEEGPIFNAINWDHGPSWDFIRPMHLSVAQAQITTFLCPSDNGTVPALGNNSYRWNVGDAADMHDPLLARTGLDRPIEGGLGAFAAGVWLNPSEFSATSATIAASEKRIGPANAARLDGRVDSWEIGVAGPTFPTTAQFVRICQTPGPIAGSPFGSGRSWFISSFWTTWYNHVAAPNVWPDCYADTVHGVFSANSQHPGGVNTLRMDGAVTFTSNSVDESEWKSLARRRK